MQKCFIFPRVVLIALILNSAGSADGTAPLSYQWKAGLNGSHTNLTNGGNIFGAANATLTVNLGTMIFFI